MHVRETVENANTVITLTTANSRITLGNTVSTKGQITLTISAADTANLVPAIYVYDLELVSSGGVVDRLIEGNFVVKAEVTR
jgi:tRNA threonylcarbamoyladenosine modification (KEOPS) complex  Pcc1 subunit